MIQYYYNKYKAEVSRTVVKDFYNVSEKDPLELFKTIYPNITSSAYLFERLSTSPYLTIQDKTSYILGQGLIFYLYESVFRNKEYFFTYYIASEGKNIVFSLQINNSSSIVFYRYGYYYDTPENLKFERGTLVQNNITAEDGAYPANGRHSDGYWYVKGARVNTAPTQPGAFSQPSGTLEIGDSKVFSVGASSDAEGNLSKYIWEVSINDAAYSKVGETTTPSFTYTIPDANNLKMRVKAVDSAGLESPYRQSSLYTVTKPMYYFSKYSVANQQVVNFAYKGTSFVTNGYPSYEIRNGGFYATGEYEYNNLGSLPVGKVIYGSSNGSLSISKYRFVDSDKVEEDIGTLSTQEVMGSLIQTGIIAMDGTYPNNGKYTDGYWYVRGSRVNQSIAPPSSFTAPTQGKKFKPNEVASISFRASTAPNLSIYEVDYRYNSTGTWAPLAYNNTLTRSLTITTDKSLKTLELRVRAKNTNNTYSDYVYSEPFEIEHNVAPKVFLRDPSGNVKLYENDTLNISGTAIDEDPDQSVTVYYQINEEPRKVLATNLSQVQIALSKQLTFKGGKLYDGDIAITDKLTEGTIQKLFIWAEDNENGVSAKIERRFSVVPNRAPMLSVDAVVPSGVIDTDTFKISGKASDEDANSTVKVTRRINAGDPVEIYSGSDGTWEFEVALAQLVGGENTIIIECRDNYGAKTSKTIKLNKKEVKTPILQSVARYKIEPPKGSAKGVLLFVQRDEELDIKVELSMTLSGEQENYVTLTPVNTAKIRQSGVEDTYEYEGTESKQNIILKITPTRTDLSFNHKIYLISGAVD